MADNIINILIASDISYAPYYGVMLTSLFVNNPDSEFYVHWITDLSITQAEKDKFNKLVDKHHSQISFYPIDNSKLINLPQSGHINYAAYYNIIASKVLPNTIHRIIYMDGDMIVNGDIRPLWELNLQENVCAQVISATFYDESQFTRLGYDKKYGIYNNGVVVYDFDKLREMDFSNKALKFIMDNPEKVTWMDQDTINVLLHDKTYVLPFRYNFQTLALSHDRWDNYDNDFRQMVVKESEHPIVIHYAGHIKPWSNLYYGYPYGRLWDKYCGMSQWRDAKLPQTYLKYIKHIIKKIVYKSNFKRRSEESYISIAWTLR